jgi:hypothetical protein
VSAAKSGERELKRCFVISPIGKPATPEREHVDDVFDYIIKPAAEQTGYAAMRADHDARPGIITEQMYDCILGDDIVVAVISFHNPNVFYEVAIAEAAARPLILLIESGQQIPFDIKDRRVLSYDMRPRSLFEGAHVASLVRAIKELEAAAAPKMVPFRPSLTPLGAGGHQRIFARAEEVPSRLRHEVVDQAQTQLLIQGISLFGLARTDGFPEAIESAAGRGVNTRVLLQHPDNPATEHELRPFASNYSQEVREEVKGGVETWVKLAAGLPLMEIRLQTRGVVFGNLLHSDKSAIYTFYSLARPTSQSPTLVVEASSDLHQALGKTLSGLGRRLLRWKASHPHNRPAILISFDTSRTCSTSCRTCLAGKVCARTAGRSVCLRARTQGEVLPLAVFQLVRL